MLTHHIVSDMRTERYYFYDVEVWRIGDEKKNCYINFCIWYGVWYVWYWMHEGLLLLCHWMGSTSMYVMISINFFFLVYLNDDDIGEMYEGNLPFCVERRGDYFICF